MKNNSKRGTPESTGEHQHEREEELTKRGDSKVRRELWKTSGSSKKSEGINSVKNKQTKKK